MQEYLRIRERLARGQSPRTRPKLRLLTVDRHASFPVQADREKIAALWVRAPHPHRIARVTTSLVVRAIVPVIQALQRHSHDPDAKIFTEKADAIRWLDSFAPGCGRDVMRLEAERMRGESLELTGS